jgi:hypothetical protein
MIKRFLPLVLMFAWAPAALAGFPPCKPSSLEFFDLSAPPPAPSGVAPWFQGGYVIDDLLGIIESARAGKCKDRLPIPGPNASTGTMGLNPGLSPIRGYGILSLPVLPTIAINGLNLQYRYNFTIDNAPLLNTGDWMDVAQLDFAQDRGQGWPISSVYRVRKVQRGASAIVQVIEARAVNGGTNSTKVAPIVSVVAEIPLTGVNGKTAIALRWTQLAQTPIGEFEAPTAPMYTINSTMEVLGMSNPSAGTADVVMYTTPLSRQWAFALWSGLLDYNAPLGGQPYNSNFYVDIVSNIDAETL